jgi:amidohydrolase
MEWSARLQALVAQELPSLISLRRDLHAHPEIGYSEVRTSAVIERELATAGIPFRGGLAGGTGILGSLPGRANHAVALRADMDALPIQEETGAPWASTTRGMMHACGHDGHTTILVGAARVLARLAHETPLPHPVALVFQPAEERGGGGRRMVADGVLDGTLIGPKVDRIVGLHCWPWLPIGHVALRAGAIMASADEIRIAIHGTGSHAALPHTGRDSVLAGSAVVVALQQIVSRTVDPLDAAVVSICVIRGGDIGNVLPDRVDLVGTMRALTPSMRDALKVRISDVAKLTAQAHGCTADVSFAEGYPVTQNDPSLTASVREQLTTVHGRERVEEFPAPVMGAEDFSYYGQRVPACFFVLGTKVADAPLHPLHSPKFDFNDQALETGVLSMCAIALGSAFGG